MLVQVVFIIDTDIDRCYKESPVLLSNALCRSCFRLLHHFSSTYEKRGNVGKSRLSQTNVKWGYKFFSRRTGQSRIESHKLYDFKMKYFEEFENEVHSRFETNAKTKLQNNEIKSCKPVDALSRAFTELLADFRWENPDLMSPVKGRRSKKEDHMNTNSVFLFSKCPKNGLQLKEFTGKQVPDEDVLLYSMFPNTLYQQFCHVAKLSLHWIDTEHISFLDNPDLKSVQIVERTVSKVRGSLSVLDSIVKNGSHHFTDVDLLYNEEVTEAEVAAYTGNDTSDMTALIPCSSFVTSLLGKQVTVSKKPIKQSDNDVFLHLGNLQYAVSLKSVEKKDTKHKDGRKRTLSTTDDGKSKVVSSADLKHLHSYGVLYKTSVGCLGTTVQNSYICVQSDSHVHNKSQDKTKLGEFSKLLSKLVSRNIMMVLQVEDSGQLVLLSPLTVHSATLSVVAMETALTLEKQLLLSSSNRSQTVSQDSCTETGSKTDLINRLVSSVHVSKQNDTTENQEVCHFDARHMDRWIIPGQSVTLQGLVTKLYSRISDLDFLSPDEAGLLKELQKCYKQNNKPPGLRDMPPPLTTTVVSSEPCDQFELPTKGKASRMSLSRTDMILSKSKAVVRERGQVKEGTKVDDKPDRNRHEITANLADFASVEELKTYLESTYQRLTSGEITSIDSTVQSMVTIVQHYMKQTEQGEDVTEKCTKLLEETVILTGSQLREKFSNSPDINVEQKIAEYESQVLLRLEMISVLQNKDQTTDDDVDEEIVGFLRALSFMSEPGLLSKFMESCLVVNYMHSIPQTLGNLFDELMQPLPEELANILSPDSTSPVRSVFNNSLTGGPPSARTRSHDSVGPASSQPGSQGFNLDTSLNRSRGGRKLVHHYSVDLGTKRQIVVDKMPSKKTEKSSSRSARKKKESHKQSKEKVAKALFGKPRDGVKLERRQSVAVMQHSNKTPKKQQLMMSPRRFVSPRRKLVAETPTHKQVSDVISEASHQRHHSIAEDMMTAVVEESPEKACHMSMRESPTKGKRTKALLRRSFYSAGPAKRTKSMTQYFQLADRIAGRKRQISGPDNNKPAKLLKLEPSAQFKSPDKNSSFLLSQLVASPSPAKTTPRKHKMTPQKVLDSPSHHTRSKLGMSPSMDLFRSPSRRQKVGSPAVHLLESPVTRRQSPRVLVADSDIKDGPKSPITTPEKSPACGVVSFGLDSPRGNRKKVSQTPTRRSVRAALFAKSPATTSHRESPFRGTASPRTLLHKFGSPAKNMPDSSSNTTTSGREKTTVKMSSLSNDIENKTEHNNKPSRTKADQNMCANIEQNSQISDRPSTSPVIVRTPTQPKTVTKTPDSFDNWHRRKPHRISQKSPSARKLTMTTKLDSISQSENILNDKLSVEDSVGQRNPGVLRNKRSLVLSPENLMNPTNKRRRTLKSEVCMSTGSQGFDVSSSFDELSQISTASSADYFSSTNDEVFVSQNNTDNNLEFNAEDIENEDVAGHSVRSDRMRHNSMFKNKTLERLLSNRMPSQESLDSERSESPIFGVSVSGRTRNKSGSFVSSDVNSGGVLDQSSPKPGKHSPGAKKFSPNVSAKSLMHLIQSPLLKSPDQSANKSDKQNKPKLGDRSRRSLKLQN